MSNTNTIVNSQLTGTTPVLAAAGTNTNLTQPLKIDDVFKTGIV